MKKILLLCAAGMSTSMLVNKMKNVATAKNINVLIEAKSVEELQENLHIFDVF
ncbi:MAG: PTS sugar transporter subunit IIB, partial [Cetobacterium sp.]